jgi:hypothetical protein
VGLDESGNLLVDRHIAPDEPAFQEPELLINALGALGKKVELTIGALCKELYFKPDTFREITAVAVPKSHSIPAIIPFSR